MTEQKGKGYQEIRVTEPFENENTVTVISVIVITKKKEKLCQNRDTRVP